MGHTGNDACSCPPAHRITGILFYPSKISTPLFLSLLFLRQLGMLGDSLTYALFCLTIVTFFQKAYNFFLIYSCALSLSIGPLTPFNLLAGLMCSNQKWKLYLFSFSALYYLPLDPDTTSPHLTVFTGLICVQIYRGLVFPTIEDNLAFFCGFFSLATGRLLRQVYAGGLAGLELACLMGTAALVGFCIIKIRITSVECCRPQSIKNPSVLVQYAKVLQGKLHSKQNVHSYILMHKNDCVKGDCFCQDPNAHDMAGLEVRIIDDIFSEFLRLGRWEGEGLNFLLHSYTELLIAWQQLPKAMKLLSDIQQSSLGYFERCHNQHVRSLLADQITRKQYFSLHNAKLKYICQYDLQLGYLIKEVREILRKKIDLWKQLCHENPVLRLLETSGSQLVARIQNLHHYFTFSIRPCQETLAEFKATLTYAAYLALTTNYGEYANSLSKKTQKLMEERKSDLKCIKQFGMFLRVTENHEKNQANLFDLVVVSISSGLCQLLGRKKEEVVLKNITSMIPEQFYEAHALKFDQFIRQEGTYKSASQFMKGNMQLPFKVSRQQVIFLETVSSLEFDCASSSLLIKCILRRNQTNRASLVVGMEGQLALYQAEAHKEVINHPKIKQAIGHIGEMWGNKRKTEALSQLITLRESTYCVNMSLMFPGGLSRVGRKPFIKLEVKNDSLAHEKSSMTKFAIANRITGAELLENKQSDSQSSNSSRKDSIENVLTLLMRSSSLKLEMFLAVVLLLMLTSLAISFEMGAQFFTTWDLSVKQRSPIFTHLSFIQIKSLLNCAVSWNLDMNLYRRQPNQTKELLGQLYGRSQGIEQLGGERLLALFSSMQNIVDNYLLGFDNEVTMILETQLNHKIEVGSGEEPAQVMSLGAIISNYMTETYSISGGLPFSSTLLARTYLPQVHAKLSSIADRVQACLEAESEGILRSNAIMIALISCALLAFLVPLWKFNTTNKKKHEKIYALLASLESRLILDEIAKLEKIQSEIFRICEFHTPSKTCSHEQISSSKDADVGRKVPEKADDLESIHVVYEGITRLAAQELNGLKTELRMKVRKRVGEVQVKGSSCDRSRVRKMDATLLCFLFGLLAILHALVWHKVRYVNIVREHLSAAIQQINYLESISLVLPLAKAFSDEYNPQNRITFEGMDLEEWLRNWIANQRIKGTQISVEGCTADMLMCKNDFSLALIEGMISKFVSDSFEAKSRSLNAGTSEEKVRFQLLFAQQLQGWLEEKKMKELTASFEESEKWQREHSLQTTIMRTAFYCGLIAFILFAVLYTVGIKNKYVREVTLLSILNKQMLYNNKRVQSFLQKLSKAP